MARPSDHPDGPPEPPPQRGRLLAALPRSSREYGEDELRVALEEFQGRPYISIRLWHKNPDGRWWPVEDRRVAVRIPEAEDVIEAIRECVRVADARTLRRAGQGPRKPTIRRDGPQTLRERMSKHRRPAANQASLPAEKAAGGEGFTES